MSIEYIINGLIVTFNNKVTILLKYYNGDKINKDYIYNFKRKVYSGRYNRSYKEYRWFIFYYLV